jgi:hypothetical protein
VVWLAQATGDEQRAVTTWRHGVPIVRSAAATSWPRWRYLRVSLATGATLAPNRAIFAATAVCPAAHLQPLNNIEQNMPAKVYEDDALNCISTILYEHFESYFNASPFYA